MQEAYIAMLGEMCLHYSLYLNIPEPSNKFILHMMSESV